MKKGCKISSVELREGTWHLWEMVLLEGDPPGRLVVLRVHEAGVDIHLDPQMACWLGMALVQWVGRRLPSIPEEREVFKETILELAGELESGEDTIEGRE